MKKEKNDIEIIKQKLILLEEQNKKEKININNINDNNINDNDNDNDNIKPIISPNLNFNDDEEIVNNKSIIKKSISKNLKSLIWDKYIGEDIIKHRCCCCKIRIIKITDFHAGHIIAQSTGGKDTIDNLRPICKECNLSMGNMNMIDYIKKHEFYINQ